jgi:hypothetical protein
MRRVRLCLMLGLLLVTPGVAGATHSNGEGPNHDSITGTGRIVAGPIDVFLHVNAKSGPSGVDPRGHVAFHAAPPAVPFPIDIQGRVTCLTIVGNQAIVGLVVTQSKEPGIPEGAGGIFTIVDMGEPGTLDRFEGSPLPAPPAVCAPPFPGRPITHGNFVVHDATA